MRALSQLLQLVEVAVGHLGAIRDAVEARPRAGHGLGVGDVLSVSEAASALRVRETEAVAWLRSEGLVRVVRLPSGRTVERVVWRQVLAALEASGGQPEAPALPQRAHLRTPRTL